MKTKLFVDAAANRSEKIINVYGKKNSWVEGYRAAVVCNDGLLGFSESFVNRKASNSLAAEAWAVLKGVECACERGLLDISIVSDAIGGFDHPAGDGSIYLRIAREIAEGKGISVAFEFVSGVENPADALSRKVTVIEAGRPEAGTVDALVATSHAFGVQKSKLRKLAAANLERAWAVWGEINSPDFRVEGRQIGKGRFVEILITRLSE